MKQNIYNNFVCIFVELLKLLVSIILDNTIYHFEIVFIGIFIKKSCNTYFPYKTNFGQIII